jgi:DNA-binding transcriptional ArsR family regulator
MGSIVEFRLQTGDLAEMVFAFSALTETALSLRVWKSPGLHPEHVAGLRRLWPQFQALDAPLLGTLVTNRRKIPDFLTPRPARSLPDPEAEFAALRRTSPGLVRDHILRAYAGEPLPGVLGGALADPSALRDRIAASIEKYWQRCLAPLWLRMRALLEADIAYRGRTLAADGAQALFADLDHRVSWQAGRLRLRFPSDGFDQLIAIGGRGLVLVPCLFVRGALTMIDPNEPPVLIYPARGRAALWDQQGHVTTAALDDLLGRTRARLLTMLDQPTSTTDLARLLEVTPSAVSRHLTALHRGRLLNRTRNGRSVLYFRSTLGDALLD